MVAKCSLPTHCTDAGISQPNFLLCLRLSCYFFAGKLEQKLLLGQNTRSRTAGLQDCRDRRKHSGVAAKVDRFDPRLMTSIAYEPEIA